MKKCIKCQIEKDISEFATQKANKDGLRGHCKICLSEYKKEYRLNNLEK